MWSISSISQIPQKRKTISAIKILHIFNPEHDYALAVGNASYTPPSSVIKLKKRFSLLPALYAGSGDYILLDPDIPIKALHSLEYYEIAEAKGLKIIYPDQIPYIKNIDCVSPWGWNHHISRKLAGYGINKNLLLDAKHIDFIRNLSHRRTALVFRKELYKNLSLPQSFSTGKEIFNEDEVGGYVKDYPYSYFKAPWSSSGRGVVSSLHVNENQLKEWAHGIIRRQGSLIAEPGWHKKLDFASEWMIRKHEAQFLGLSVFKTSDRGKYHGNIRATQHELLRIVEAESSFSFDIIESQKKALNHLISPFYEGPLGIDMLADISGNVNSCVEINLRLTMGHIFLENFSISKVCIK